MTERDIFLALLDLPDAAARYEYLNRVCGDDVARRARLDSLLSSHETAASFLGSPAVAPPEPNGATLEFGVDRGQTSDDDVKEADADFSFLGKPRLPDSLGRLGHYEVLEVLGKGGFGIVFRAFDEMLQRVVAIKVLAPQMATTSPARKRFLREARSSARVRHEHVVQVYAVEEQPLPYLVMEFIPGETLQQRLDRSGPIETVEVVRIGKQLAEGLAAAHAQGIIHRDIKPGNILIEAGANLSVKITDFGLARAADDASLTQSGIIAGTPMFMAPEQAHGEALDHRADLFSLGSVLYTMASGRPPFRANSTLAVLKRVAEDTPRPIREIIPEMPRWLCDLISHLHAKQPDDRIATAREVADLLGRGLAEMRYPSTLALPALAKIPAVRATPEVVPVISRPHFRIPRWAIVAAVLLLSIGAFTCTEASGVTNVRGTVIRLFSPQGTLVVEVEDSDVSVKIDGSDLVITGAGAREIRLTPGSYTIEARKDGKLVCRELVNVTKNGRKVVRVSQEPLDAKAAIPGKKGPNTNAADASAWERVVTVLSAAEQVKAVGARLKDLNPGFDGAVESTIENDVVRGLKFTTDDVKDIAPVRVLTKLRSLECSGTGAGMSQLCDLSPLRGLSLTTLGVVKCRVSDLSPLRGMPLMEVICHDTSISDLSPLEGMKLKLLDCSVTPVSNLSPLKGMPLETLLFSWTKVRDLKPLAGMKLQHLGLEGTTISDLSPLKGMKLGTLNVCSTQVSDLSPLEGMKLTLLHCGETRVSDLAPLKGMPLQVLNCEGTKVGDKDLAGVEGWENLNHILVRSTKVTPAGIDELKKALPKCKIEWDGGVIEPK